MQPLPSFHPVHGDESPAKSASTGTDVYFSADVETDGPIPGPYSILSFALVYAGRYDGRRFVRPDSYDDVFEIELKPISTQFQPEALAVNRIDRDRLLAGGADPRSGMQAAGDWICRHAAGGTPILVAYPLSFDWSWLYWYFTYFLGSSPFNHSRCFDIKTAYSVKSGRPICDSSRSQLPAHMQSTHPHTHRAADDAISQAQIFARLFDEWC